MTLRTWLEENPFTLSLSSGFFGFFAHTGFVKALEDSRLAPRKLTGSSSGAIVAAAMAVGLKAQEIEKIVLGLKLDDFWDPALGLGFVRGKKIEKLIGENIGRDFSAAKIPLSVSTFNIFKRKTEVFSSGDMPRVIRASSAIPLMFHPVMIDGQLHWDGGILDKMGLADVAEDECVLGHSLQQEKTYERFDRGFKNRIDGKNRKTVTLRNLPRSGPRKLYLGSEIVESAYKQTLEVLRSPI